MALVGRSVRQINWIAHTQRLDILASVLLFQVTLKGYRLKAVCGLRQQAVRETEPKRSWCMARKFEVKPVWHMSRS
jgi:hypothetical protein